MPEKGKSQVTVGKKDKSKGFGEKSVHLTRRQNKVEKGNNNTTKTRSLSYYVKVTFTCTVIVRRASILVVQLGPCHHYLHYRVGD
jgi:hypothetical protein